MAASKATTGGIERRVRADGKVSYRVLIRRVGAPTISKTFRTYADARTFRQRMDADFSTAKAIEKAFLGYWRAHAAQIRLMDLEARLPGLVDALADAKGAGSTANRYLGFLQRVIRKARGWKWIDRNPVDDVDRFPEGKARERVIRPEELQAHRKAFEKDQHPWVFPGRSMYKPAQFAPYFAAARDKAGIRPDRRSEQLVMHSLRHSAASEMGDGGATMIEIMAAGGWKSPSMVRRYVKDSTRQAVAAIRKRQRSRG